MTGYDILGYEKVNEVDDEKVRYIVESMKKDGFIGCPILTYGNVLLTGSHRLAAIEKLYDEEYDVSFECAEDVSDIIDEKIENGELEMQEVFENTDNLSYIFEGTWVENYKEELEW